MNYCNQTNYTIQKFSYTPLKKTRSLEERREAFRSRLKKVMDEVDPKLKEFPSWLRIDFWNYWTALDNDFGKKMKFEKEKSWNTKLRLNTWKKNSEKDKRWNSQKQKVYIAPKQKNIDYGRTDPEKAKERLRKQSVNKIMGAGERLKNNW